ncbi:hypothetical protein MNBD_GAMMA21-1002 [hydrothermal vent metagenome]|uniref:Peptidase S54 rhomboid domain-containing protein n=1 Tax=hydrothermal vent metagenome TaxID=652676 RepID=A0A3B0ZX76_9ZZZZ
MFLPLDRKPDWKNPPLITLILVIANIFVFYMWQLNDDQRELDTYAYYSSSELDLIELKAYVEFKVQHKDSRKEPQVTHDTYQEMRTDGKFQNLLEQELIIKPGSENYDDWRSRRDHFEQLRDRSISSKYAFNPSQPRFVTYFTSLFLHADSGHLFGNMILLILLGLGIEILLGRSLFLLGYLISGLSANGLSVLIDGDKFIYGLGASGAIAGVMGMAIVIYGFRKINFFYFLIFYFDVVKARAIWLLPIYIFSQAIIEFAFNTNTNVTAHIGGFLGGLIFTGILKLTPNAIKHELIDTPQQQTDFTKKFSDAQALLASMNIEAARKKFLALNKKYPGNQIIQQQLFTIAKYNPASDEYHELANKLLSLTATDKETINIIHATYRHYASHAKPRPRWTPELLAGIAMKFSAHQKITEAENIINYLIKSIPDFSHNAAGLATLIEFYKNREQAKYEKYLKILLELYPNSTEAQKSY